MNKNKKTITKEEIEFITAFRELPIEKQIELFYMINGAAFAAGRR